VGAWLGEHFPATPRTASNYMRIAEGWSILEAKSETVSELTMRSALRALAPPRAAVEPLARTPDDVPKAPRKWTQPQTAAFVVAQKMRGTKLDAFVSALTIMYPDDAQRLVDRLTAAIQQRTDAEVL
jgi:hypothetical protein